MKFEYSIDNQDLNLRLNGDYINFDDEPAKTNLLTSLKKQKIRNITIDATGLKHWDSTLIVVLYELGREAQRLKLNINYDSLPQNLHRLIDLAFMVNRKPSRPNKQSLPALEAMGAWGIDVLTSVKKGWNFIRQSLHSVGRLFISKAIMRPVDFLFALGDCSYKAVGIVSLVSFMIGLILAFVGAVQLKTFGAQIYVSSLVAISMTRIMGAIMVGIIMAGRTGASYAATIGTMQVNEEIDALKTMGIPITDFLVLPRILALTISIPFLVILADLMGILGGVTVGVFMLDINASEYYKYTYEALSMDNFMIGLFHAFVFGLIISICGCFYGVYCGRNADSVGKATTQAVVAAIVWMIIVTGMITFILEVLGL